MIDGQQIIRTYMECPNCKRRYNVCFDNNSTLVKKKQIRMQTKMLQKVRDLEQREQKKLELEKRKRNVLRETKILRMKYERQF